MKKIAILLVIGSILFLIPRCAQIKADPPHSISPVGESRELYGEGPFKVHEARKFALLGSFSTNAADTYRFWLVQAPVHVISLGIWLKTFGVSWPSVRAFGILVALIGFLCIGFVVGREMPLGFLYFYIIAATLNYYAILASRTGLIEITLNTVLSLGFVIAWLALRNWLWLFALQWALIVAFLTKQSGLLFLPFAIFATILALRQSPQSLRKKVLGLSLHALILIPNVLRALAQSKPVHIFGRDYPTPDGTCVRDYIHIADLTDAHIAATQWLLKKKERSFFSAFNLGTGKGHSNLEIVKMCEKVTGRKAQIEWSPRRPGDATALHADPFLAQKEFNFSPQASELENIIRTAWAWELHKNSNKS